MPADNVTVILQWVINNYTLTFNYGNGTVIRQSYEYNETVAYPDTKREGYMFDGWEPNIAVMPAHNVTAVAQWKEIIVPSSSSTEIVSEYVEVIFETKNMTEDEIRAFIEKYTDEKFTIEKVESENGETTVIIRFEDSEKANDFVRKVDNIIKSGQEKIVKRTKKVGCDKCPSHAPRLMTLSIWAMLSIIF